MLSKKQHTSLCQVEPLTLSMEVICPSEMLGHFWTTQNCNTEDRSVQNWSLFYITNPPWRGGNASFILTVSTMAAVQLSSTLAGSLRCPACLGHSVAKWILCDNLLQLFSTFLRWRNPWSNIQVSGNPYIQIIIKVVNWSSYCYL